MGLQLDVLLFTQDFSKGEETKKFKQFFKSPIQ